MDRLILVKHSMPEIDRSLPASRWHLGEAGRRRARALASRLRAYGPDRVLASPEPKAHETAVILAEALTLPLATVPGLHEHLRETVGWREAPAFEGAVETFFRRPSELVFGEETAEQARWRFGAAVEAALVEHPTGTPIIVAHGTVIALYVAAIAGLDGLALWRRLDLPGFVVLSRPSLAVAEIVDRIEATHGD